MKSTLPTDYSINPVLLYSVFPAAVTKSLADAIADKDLHTEKAKQLYNLCYCNTTDSLTILYFSENMLIKSWLRVQSEFPVRAREKLI